MSKYFWITLFCIMGGCVGIDSGRAENLSSDHYEIDAQVISGGGGMMTSDSYTNQYTIGQPTPLQSDGIPVESTSYTLLFGFWNQVRSSECECRLSDLAGSFGVVTSTPSTCCDISWDGDVDGEDLFLAIPGL